MSVANPCDLEAEREILVRCLAESGEREEIISTALAELSPQHFANPHHAYIFAGLQEAVRDAGEGVVDWTEVRDLLDAKSQARNTLRELVRHPAHTRRTPRKLVGRLNDAYRGREVLNLLEHVKPMALAMRTEEAFDALLDGVFTLGRDRFSAGARHVSEFIPGFLEELELRRTAGGMAGLKTGLKVFDRVFGGMQQEKLYVLGGLPGNYKTAVANQAAMNVARQDKRALIQTPEMSGTRLVSRWACTVANVSPDKYNTGTFTADEERRLREAADHIRARNIIIDPSGHVNTVDIRKNLIRFRPDFLVVDYLGLVDPPRKQYNEYRDTTEACKEINAMKKDFALPILLLSQLSREVERRWDKRPISSDLRNSGQIEADADGIILNYYAKRYARPYEVGRDGTEWRIYKSDDDEDYSVVDPEVLEFLVPKNRDGDAYDVKARVKPDSMWIEDYPWAA
jgi:replicative DNA helicase